MADEFIPVEVETNPDELAAEAIAYLEGVIPGFVGAAGNLEVWLIEAVARIAAEVRDVAADVPLAIFRYFGNSVAGIPPVDPVSATALSSWTMIDTNGYTIPEGSLVGMIDDAGTLIAFETGAEVTVPNGSNTTLTDEVPLIAVDAGVSGNDLNSPTLISALDFVFDITLAADTSGGLDGESDEDYLDRLSSELRLLSPRPILPNDFAVLARRVTGVDRATAIDGFIPPASFGEERAVAVAIIDEDGQPCSGGIQTAVDDYLQSQREVNFIVSVIDPDYTPINISFTAVCFASYDAATVEAAAEQNASDYIDPKNWGLGELGTGETREWFNTDTVRYLEVAAAINNTDGLDYITALTVNAGTVDVPLTGNATLPSVGTVTGTVTAP